MSKDDVGLNESTDDVRLTVNGLASAIDFHGPELTELIDDGSDLLTIG